MTGFRGRTPSKEKPFSKTQNAQAFQPGIFIQKKLGFLVNEDIDIHGSDHPEDSRFPLVMISDIYELTAYQDRPYKVSQLKTLLDTLVME